MSQDCPSQRSGTVLISVLVCMGIATTLILGSVHVSLSVRRQLRNELQLEQTRWLLDAGIRKGIIEIQRQPTYAGESVTLSPSLKQYLHATAEIAVDNAGSSAESAEETSRLRVSVRVGDPQGVKPSMRRSREIVISGASQNED